MLLIFPEFHFSLFDFYQMMLTAIFGNIFEPLMPRRTQVSVSLKFQFFYKQGSSNKFPYERRAYESVDEKSLSKVMSRKMTIKRTWSIKG